MVVVACFMFLHLSLVSSHHAYQSIYAVHDIVDCVCQRYLRWRLIVVYSYCIVDSIPISLSFRVQYRYLFDARTAALLVPADDRATASTFQQNDARYRLDGGLTGYHYIAKAQ